VAGLASPNSGKPASAAVPAALLSAAQQNPSASFNVIVEGSKGQSSNGVANDVTTGNGKLKRKFLTINGVSASLTGGDILKLAKNPHVSAIVLDATLKVADYQNEEMWRQSTGVTSLWSKPAVTCATNSLTGLQLDPSCIPSPAFIAPQAPAIAIVDSGIDASKLGDFGSRVVARRDFVSADNGTDPGGDPEGHGTMVAGVAAGAGSTYPGVAQNAPLVDARVAGPNGCIQMSDVLAALDWILQSKAQYNIGVVNMSLTGNGEASIETDPVDQAVEKLWLNGIVVVAAAGNQGQPSSPVPLSSPGNDPFVITVGAVDTNGTASPSDDFRAPWSAYGTTADGFGKPELAAPGRYIIAPVPAGSYLLANEPTRSPAPGYMWMSGTSFASPVVAGVAAQVLAAHPGWSPDQVKGALMASATQLADHTSVGMGEVNAAAAAAMTAPPNPNANLYQFVSTDANGVRSFDATAWGNAVTTQSGWTESGWTESGWTESGWTQSGWTASGWTESGWTESGWTESGWTESGWVE
jgi:serine protease AprX